MASTENLTYTTGGLFVERAAEEVCNAGAENSQCETRDILVGAECYCEETIEQSAQRRRGKGANQSNYKTEQFTWVVC